MNQHGHLRYSLDSSLGRLARYLRLLGHDAAWTQGDSLAVAVARARSQGRALLTRSMDLQRLGLAWPPSGGMVIRSDRWTEQLEEMAGRWPLFLAARPFSRCADCNLVLLRLSLDEARPRIPPYVAATRTTFRRCPGCERIFWSGTHAERILSSLGRIAARCGQRLGVAGDENADAGPDHSDPASTNR